MLNFIRNGRKDEPKDPVGIRAIANARSWQHKNMRPPMHGSGTDRLKRPTPRRRFKMSFEAVQARRWSKMSLPPCFSRISCSFPVIVVEQAAKVLNAVRVQYSAELEIHCCHELARGLGVSFRPSIDAFGRLRLPRKSPNHGVHISCLFCTRNFTKLSPFCVEHARHAHHAEEDSTALDRKSVV